MSTDHGPPTKSIKLQDVELSLNHDTLIHVFKFCNKTTLKSVAQVCKTWKQAAYTASLWKGCVADLKNRPISEETASNLRLRNIKVVKISLNTIKPEELQRLSEVAQIKVLVMRKVIATGNIAEQFPAQFESLRSLSVHHLRFDSESISTPGLQRLLLPLTNLNQLHISWEPKPLRLSGPPSPLRKSVDNDFNYFTILFESCPQLKDLEISGIGNFMKFNFSQIFLGDKYPKLHRLALHGQCAELGVLTDNICKHFDQLKHLAIEILECEYDDTAYNTSHTLTQLESFCPNSSYHVEWVVQHIHHVLEMSKNITALDMSCAVPGHHLGADYPAENVRCIYEEHVELIFTNLPGLKFFNIHRQQVSLSAFNISAALMSQLEVLVLGSMWCLEEEEDQMEFLQNLEKWSNLISLLGLEFEPHCYGYLYTSSIEYVDGNKWGDERNWNEDLVKIKFHPERRLFEQIKLETNSPDWHRATGSRFFQLPGSYQMDFEYHNK